MAKPDLQTTVRLGQVAPDFTLSAQDDSRISLSDFRGEKSIVLYFYPGDFTEGCTQEACAFRDSYRDFEDAGAEVIGVSKDSLDSHRRFIQNHDLPFTLLSDPDRRVRMLYNSTPGVEELPKRVTFVIDKAGVVRLIFSHKRNVQEHIDETLALLKRIG